MSRGRGTRHRRAVAGRGGRLRRGLGAFGLVASVLSGVVVAVGAGPAEAKNFGASKTEWKLTTTTGDYGQPFTFHVFVIDDSTSCDLPPYPHGCNTPTGTVYFYLDGDPGWFTSARVVPFDADFSTVLVKVSNLAPGPHSIRARYVGGVSSVSNPRPFEESEATAHITIRQAKVTGTLGSSANPATIGQAVTFSMTVTPNPAVDTAGGAVPPTGDVQFVDITGGANTILATKPLSAGGASHTVANLPLGTRRIAGVYLGDQNYEARSIGTVDQVVAKTRPSIAASSSAGGMLGTPVRDGAFVSSPLDPTGTVTFRLFSDAGCTNAVFASTKILVNGVAVSDWFSPASPGTYRWTTVYSGDSRNESVATACNNSSEVVTIRPFAAPAFTRVVSGEIPGPVTVEAGESVLLDGARILGNVTVRPGGSLTAVNARIRGAVAADSPAFFSMCGTWVDGRPAARALTVANARVPIRAGDPAAGCAGNGFIGSVALSGNLAVMVVANHVTGDLVVDGNGPGNAVVRANQLTGTLACAGNAPAPVNLGQPNTAAAATGQCLAL